MSNLISVLFQVGAMILLIKLYHDLVIKKHVVNQLLNKVKNASSWNETNASLEKMEHRLKQIQSREIAGQERVWKLEDENRVLLSHVQHLRGITNPTEPEPDDDHDDWHPVVAQDDNDDDDDEPRTV